uniref:Uncharacterized protein n=1 Tax=Tanacetum cinerariifolium TaxID=118510 RepID=A0A6L2JRI7_TANCI|nr:hypothetical protein [Tanacetum cinerariifolium]
MQEADEAEPAKVEEVLEVVTAAKLMTKLVTTATTITAAPISKAKVKTKDKGKGILVEEPKPLRRQAQIEQDKAFARELEAQLNANINWNDVIEQVKRKEKQDNTVMRYQSLKWKLVTQAQARKNMIVYLKNMAGFKMDFLKRMSYTDIRPIFKKHFNSNWAFLEKGEKEIEEEESKLSKRKSESSKEKAAKKQKIDEEVEELKTHLQIVPSDEDGVYTKVTPLALKPKNFSDDFLLNALKTMFEKPNVKANIWKNQRGRYGFTKVKSWRLLESCGVYIITFTTTEIILLVERRHPLTRFTLDQMLNNVKLEVKEESKVSLELLRFVRRQHKEGYKPDFGVDDVEDFKEYMLRDYYCWLKTYCCCLRDKDLQESNDPQIGLVTLAGAAALKELCLPVLIGIVPDLVKTAVGA